MSRRFLVPIVTACLGLGACSSFGDPVQTSPHSQARREAPRNDPGGAMSVDLRALIIAYTGDGKGKPDPTVPLEYALAAFDRKVLPAIPEPETAPPPDGMIDSTTARIRRNAIVGRVLVAADQNCDIYLVEVRRNQVALKRITPGPAPIASGVASAMTPSESASILGALGAAPRGLGGNLDDANFNSKLVEVIATAIRAHRTRHRAEIEARMAEGYWDWTLARALADAADYDGRCNMLTGLGALQEAAVDAAKQAEKKLAAVRAKTEGQDRQ